MTPFMVQVFDPFLRKKAHRPQHYNSQNALFRILLEIDRGSGDFSRNFPGKIPEKMLEKSRH